MRPGKIGGGVRERRDVACQKYRAIVVLQKVNERFVRDQKLRPGILDHKRKPLRRIRGIQRLVRRARLGHADGSNGHEFIARDQDADHILPADAQAADVEGEVVRQMIKRPIGELPVAVDHSGVVRRLCRLRAQKVHKRRGPVIRRLRGVHPVHEHRVRFGHDWNLGKRLQAHHAAQHRFKHQREALDGGAIIKVAAVIDGDGVASAAPEDHHGDVCQRAAGFKGLKPGIARAQPEAVQRLRLIHVQDVRFDAELARHLFKRELVVAHRLIKLILQRAQGPGDLFALVIPRVYRQRSHKHPDGVFEARVVTAVVDRREQALRLAGELRQRVAKRAEENGALGDGRAAREVLRGLHGERFTQIADISAGGCIPAVRFGFVIKNDVGIHFISVQEGSKMVACRLESVRLPETAFAVRQRERVDRFRLQGFARISARDLAQEYVRRRAVKNDVMYVHQEVVRDFGAVDFKAEQRPGGEVKRPYEGAADRFHILFPRLLYGDFAGHLCIRDKGRIAAQHPGFCTENGIRVHDRADGVPEAVHVHSATGKAEAAGYVVHRGSGRLNAFQIDPKLAVGQPARAGRHVAALKRVAVIQRAMRRKASGDARGRAAFENIYDRKPQPAARFLQHHRLDRIAAQRKEIVVDPHPVQFQNALKTFAQLGLRLVFRRGVAGLKEGRVRRGQVQAIQFSVCIERERLKLNQKQRHHVIGQQRLKPGAHVRRRDGLLGFVVAAQIVLSMLVFKLLDHGGPDVRVTGHRVLNFTRLHALTVDLDHPVLAVDVFHVAVRQPPGEVAGVEVSLPIDRGERFRRRLRQIQVFQKEFAAYANLALSAGHAVLIDQRHLQPVRGLADGGVFIGFVHQERRNRQRDLAHSIDVVEAIIPGGDLAQAFAPGQDIPQVRAPVMEVLEQLGADEDAGDVIFRDIVRDL